MENPNELETTRRKALKMLALGSSAGVFGLFNSPRVNAETYETPSYQKGAAPVTIKSVKAIVTAPGAVTW
jgi:mannonate dehydratase